MNDLTIFVNNQAVYDFDRETTIEEDKLAFLDKMDSDMNRGIKVQGEFISDPDNQQRARFVAMNLIKALQQKNLAMIQASCAYLINRMPRLVEVKINEEGSKIHIALVEEELN